MRESVERDIERIDESRSEETKVDELPPLGRKASILGEKKIESLIHAKGGKLFTVRSEGKEGASWAEVAGKLGERGGGFAEVALEGDLAGVL